MLSKALNRGNRTAVQIQGVRGSLPQKWGEGETEKALPPPPLAGTRQERVTRREARSRGRSKKKKRVDIRPYGRKGGKKRPRIQAPSQRSDRLNTPRCSVGLGTLREKSLSSKGEFPRPREGTMPQIKSKQTCKQKKKEKGCQPTFLGLADGLTGHCGRMPGASYVKTLNTKVVRGDAA